MYVSYMYGFKYIEEIYKNNEIIDLWAEALTDLNTVLFLFVFFFTLTRS